MNSPSPAASNAAPAATDAADDVPQKSVWLRAVIKIRATSEGRGAPLIPSHFHTFGGKTFATFTARVVRNDDGETVALPQRGCIEEFMVGGPNCDIEKVRASVARHVTRWRNRDTLRGEILSTRTREALLDERGDRTGKWIERKNPHYVPKAGDEPVAPFLSLEVVVPGADTGPEIDLTPGAPFPPQLDALLKG